MPNHCWMDRGEYYETIYGFNSPEHNAVTIEDELGATCMLADGHDGPHEWTPDDSIGVSFEAGTEGTKMSDSKRASGKAIAAEMRCETHPYCGCDVEVVCAERAADRWDHVLRKMQTELEYVVAEVANSILAHECHQGTGCVGSGGRCTKCKTTLARAGWVGTDGNAGSGGSGGDDEGNSSAP